MKRLIIGACLLLISLSGYAKTNQTITFPAIPNKIYGDADFTITATASSGLTVIFTSANTNIATVTGNVVHIVAAGTVIIHANQPGDGTYNPAPQVDQNLTIALTVTNITADNKIYDGTTAAALTTTGYSLNGIVAGDNVTLDASSYTANFNNKHIGTGKTVTVGGLALSGTDAAKYTLAQPTGLTANITAKSITVTAQTESRGYNATTSSSVTPVITGSLATGDTQSFIQTFDNKNVGSGKTLTPSGSVNDGNSGLNYSVSFVTVATGVINTVSVTVTAQTENRVYNATASSSLSPNVSGILGSDGVSTAPTQSYDTRHVGTGKTITASGLVINDGNSGNNYTISYVSKTNGVITTAPVTVTAQTDNRVYNATTSSSLSPSVAGILGSDGVSTAPTQSYDTRHVGATKTITASGLVISDGNGGNNYAISYVSKTNGVITKAPVTVTAQADNKVFSGTTSSSVTPVVAGIIAPDLVSTSPTQTYNTKHVGTVKTMTAIGLVINDGNSGGNYNITYFTNVSGVITAYPITVTAQTDSKLYNATVSSSIVPGISPGLLSGDTPSFIQTFDNKNVGTGKTLTPSGSVNDGNSGNNYSVSFVTNTTGIITSKPLTIGGSFTANNKQYDGNTSAIIGTNSLTLIGVISGDIVTLNPVAAFASKNVGNNITVNLTSGSSLSGTDGGNYIISLTGSPTTTANITPPPTPLYIGGSFTVNSTKVYDATTASTIAINSLTLIGIQGSDNVTLTAVATYSDKNAGIGKTVNLLTSTLAGADAANYNLNFTGAPTTTADITPKTLTIGGSFTASSKVYNALASAFISINGLTLITKEGSDDVTLKAVAAFANKTAGSGKTVSLTGSTLLGTDAANYILSFTGAPVSTANITQANLSVTGITASSKTYDATTAATLGGTPAVTPLLSDLVTPGGTPSGTFADKNTGITKPITITGVTISGTDAANYNLIQQTGLTADIISLTVTIGGSFIAGNKVYDATTDAAISTNLLTLVTKAGSDVVNLSPVATFADKNIGTGKIVSLTGTTLTGADAGNYTLSLTGAPTATANITPLTLTIGGSFTVSSKVYDATNSATISSNGLTLATIAGSDIVTLNAVAVFANKITGTGKTVGLAGSSISGADAGNYTLSLTGSPTATANITRKTLTVGGSFTASNKVYDANTSASIATNSLIMNTIAGSDTVNLNAVAVFANKLIGTGKTVSLTGSSLAGADAGNYTLSLTGSPVSTANITPLTVTIGGSFTVSNKVYDASSSATISTNSLTLLTKAGSDGLSLTAVAVFANKLIGSAKTVSLAGSTLAGADAGNYTLSLTGAPTATANITAKALTVTGIVAKNRSYDGTNVASLNTTANTLVGVLGSEIVKLDTSSYTASFTAKTIGAGKPVTVSGLALTGADAGNYTLTQPTGLTANIVAKPLTVTLSVNDKLYDCTVTATLNTTAYILNGIVGTETVTLNSSAYTASFNNLSVGLDKPVTVSGLTLSGADAGNYTLTQPAGLTASIERKTLTVTVDNISKSYGDPNPAFTVSYTGFAPCDDIYVVTIPPTVSTTATQFSDINTYPLIPSGAFASNYSFIYVNGTLTVTKASLTVTANNKSRIYGDNNPVLDLAYSGFRGTDTKAVLDVEPTVSTSAVKTSNAGTYSITVTGGSDNNYTYTYVNGTLTVNKAPLRIFIHNMRKFQGDAVPTLAAYIYKNSDFKFAGDNSTLDFSMTLSATCTAASVPGNYVIDFPTAPVDNNYVVTDTSFNTPYKKGIFYVHPKISITAQPSQQKACEYLNVQFTFTNTGVFQKYLWQVKKRATDSFHYIISTDSLSHKGDSTAVLTVDPIISTNNGFQFQCSIVSEFWEDSLATTKTLRSNSLTTNPATLVVDKSPPQSPVLKKGNMLICSNDSVTAWQWGDAAGTISGQTKQYFTPTDISNFKKYWVLTTNKSGCTTKVYFNDDPPFDWHAYGVKIAPTPNNGTFTVTASGLTANTLIQVEVYDLKGNKYSNSAKKQTTGTELIIQSSEINGGTKLKPGFYFIVVSQTIVSGPSKVYKRGVGKIIVNSN